MSSANFLQSLISSQFYSKMEKVEGNSPKSSKTFFYLGKEKVYFSGDFDSGNLQKVEQLSAYVYRITPGYDQLNASTRKTFFHFQVFGFHKCTVKFQITRCHILQTLIKNNFPNNVYHPVVKKSSEGSFEKVKSKTQIYYNAYGEPQLTFYHDFSQSNWAEFAFTYPYSYSDCQNFLKELEDKYSNHSGIYFHRQLLCLSKEKRRVDLLTLTNLQNCKQEKEKPCQGIFPENNRPYKIEKPKIVISARVHPGQAPSSYCLEGIVRFLLNQKDFRSALLRKHFHFIVIPMLNPDGVSQGTFRTDNQGHNLNRFYKHCNPEEQQTIWGVTTYLSSIEKVDFFFDLHSHPSLKSFFIYGNAFDSLWHQVEAQLFGKLVEYNCPYFQNLDSIFTEKAMKSKEKHDRYTKQGCARVYYHKKFKIIHSFTVESGYFWPTKVNPLLPYTCSNIESNFCYTSDWQSVCQQQYTAQSYMLLGKSLMTSILDLFNINPYSRIGLNSCEKVNDMRRELGQKIFGQVQRFRLREKISYRKINQISSIINEKYYKQRFGGTGLSMSIEVQQKSKKLKINSLTSLPHSISLDKGEKEPQSCPKNQDDQALYSQSSDDQQSNIHHQLLTSFAKYKAKPSHIKIRKLKTLENQGISNKSVKSIHLRTEKDEYPVKKIENEMLQKLIKGKLNGGDDSVVKLKEGRLSRYQWSKDKKNHQNRLLPSLTKSSKKIVLLASNKSIKALK